MRKKSVLVDTNVPLTANGKAAQADVPCMRRCLQELRTTQRERRVLLDSTGLILQEYLRQKPHGFPQGPGDIFLVWVYDNQANPANVLRVPITPLNDETRDFTEFPEDADLKTFDRSDRKFVAVALASGESPLILNATDTDWWIHRKALEHNHVLVQFLCPNLMGVSEPPAKVL
jgi:hypothetical protein